MNRFRFATTLCVAAVMLVGCSSAMTRVHRAGNVKSTAKWALLPVQNHSETPQAGERIEAMLDTLLRKQGVNQLDRYPLQPEDDAHLLASDRQRYETALEWARGARFDYAITGSVEEWRYKSGLDGEPAIGITMRVLDVRTGRVLWSASGTQTGGAAENASGTALKLLTKLVDELHPETSDVARR